MGTLDSECGRFTVVVTLASAYGTSRYAKYHYSGHPVSQVLGEPYQLVIRHSVACLSLPITFAAAFLTLDRTRTFTPTSTTISTRSRGLWQFQGGSVEC